MFAELSPFEKTFLILSLFVTGGIVFCNILVFVAVIRKNLLATPQNQFILGLAASDFLVCFHNHTLYSHKITHKNKMQYAMILGWLDFTVSIGAVYLETIQASNI